MCQRSPSTALLPLLLLIIPLPLYAGSPSHDVVLTHVSTGTPVHRTPRRVVREENYQYVANTRGAARSAARQVAQASQYSQLPDHRPQNDQGQELAHEHYRQQQEEQEPEDDQEQYESIVPYNIPNSKQYPPARPYQYPPPQWPPPPQWAPKMPLHYPTHYKYNPHPNPLQYPNPNYKYPYPRPGAGFRFPPYMIPGGYAGGYQAGYPGGYTRDGGYYGRPHFPPPTWITGRSGVSGPASLPGRPLGKWPCDMVHSVHCNNDKYCVAKEALCDGIDDCGDMTDETHCPAPANCTQAEFQCANHECVPHLWRCDGEPDCIDSSDELNCTSSPCSDVEFSCGDGSCISAAMHCNKIPDCPDNSDEENCEEPHFPSCDGDELTCKYPLCVLNEYKCDGDNDCGDWSDEKDCENGGRGMGRGMGGAAGGGVIGTPGADAVCTADHFRCTDGTCIPKRARCDGHGDCDSGEDEERCENFDRYPNTCSPGQRACNAGRCISAQWFCDGEPDCSTGEDEENCPPTCNADHEYKCASDLPANGTAPAAASASIMTRSLVCIRKTQVCDAQEDCPQKDDEAGCPVVYQCDANSGCAVCLKAADGSGVCGCKPGFTLAPDGVKCMDIDECSEEHGPCQHECKNVEGSFLCSCRDGYMLRSDQRSCKRVGSVAKLIISNRVDIREVNLNTLYSSVVLPGLHNAVALDIHYRRNEIYWIDFSMHLVKRAYINGSGETDLVQWGIQEPNGLAIDWVHDIMLWTDSYWRRVQASTLDGTSIYTVVHTGLDKPRDIAVSPKHGLIFWTDWGPNPRVERAGLDGSNRKAIITEDTKWPNGLALDADGERIYWADARYHVIETAKIDGSDRRALVDKGLPHPFALTVLEEEIYWTDWHTRSVMAADKTGKRRRTLLNRLHFPMQVHSFHNSSQRPAKSRCPKAPFHCRYLCLPNEQSYTCVCPIGTKLLKDGYTCERVPKKILLYIRNKEIRIRGIPSESNKGNDVALIAAAEEVVPVNGVRSAVSLDWDDTEDLIFWSDKKTKTISCAHRNGTGQRVILDSHLQNPIGISFDYVTRRMYFIDALNKRIESVDLEGNLRVVLISDLQSPQSLVVHPPARQMVWSDYRDGYTKKRSVYIEAAGMDGENRRTLKIIPASAPIHVSLAVDTRDGRVYWSNSGTETIESMMLDGSSQESTIERPNAGTPIGLSVLAGRIFWADNSTGRTTPPGGQIRENRSEAALRAGVTSLRGISIWHDTRHKMDNPCSPAKNNGGCAHICLLAYPPPAITCRCRMGYTLMADKRSCSKWPSTSLLMVKNSELCRFPLNMPYILSETMPITKMINVAAADVDTVTGEIYWVEADLGVIMRVPSEAGNDTAEVVVKYIGRSYGVAVDATSRNIYWTDFAKRTLEVQQIDAGYRRVLIWEGLEKPYSVVTMPSHGFLFWSDWGQEMGKIERSQMDGYERASILSENIGCPNALTIDVKEERIYWTDVKMNSVESAKIDGGSRRVVLRDRPEPYGVALYGDAIYWSDAKTMALHMVNRKGGSETTVMTGLRAVLSLKVLTHPNDTKSEPKRDDGMTCDRSKCSHLCLPVPKPKGNACACPTGLPLLPGGTNCSLLPEAELFFALGRGPPLGRMALPPVRFHDTPLSPEGVEHTAALDYHWQKKLVVFVSSHYRMLSETKHQTSSIMAISLENVSKPYVIVNVTEGYVEGIAVDWVADNIFWTDVTRAVIEVARLDGTSRKTIIKSSYESSSLRSVAVFPRMGLIFWSDWLSDGNAVARIERAGLDGSNRTTIVETDLERPNGLTIDYKAHRLYWADSGRGRIESSKLCGKARLQLVPDAPHLFGLTMHGEYVYWTNYELHTVERANKFTGRNPLAADTAMMDIRDVKAVSESRQSPGGACQKENGGCSHLCLARPNGYLCACPDAQMVGPGQPGYCAEREMVYEDTTTEEPGPNGPIPGLFDPTHKDSMPRAWSTVLFLALMVGSIVVLLLLVVSAGFVIWQRNMKGSTAKYQPSDPVVITFSNPNYYSEGPSTGSAEANPGNTGCVPDIKDDEIEAVHVSSDKYPIMWRRLKYDKTMECVTIGRGVREDRLGNAEATALISTASSPVAGPGATSVMAATDPSVIA